MTVDPGKLREFTKTLEELQRRKSENALSFYKPYPPQVEFHAAGKTHRERLFMAGNQSGKSLAGSFELAAHLTGEYSPDWPGRRFNGPIRAWSMGITAESTRDAPQRLLLGPLGARGTGCIPAAAILEVRAGRGVGDVVDTALIRHKSGGVSHLGFKSYERGREKLQGESIDCIFMDEEPPADVYSECLARISARQGMIYLCFTPLMGMSVIVRRFLDESSPDRAVIRMTIDDAEHIPLAERQRVIDAYPEHEREARTRGVPQLGSGRIYPIAESIICIPPMEIPQHFARLIAVDFGYQNFAAVSLAWDRDSDAVYLVDCYKSKEETPIIHAATLKTRFGEWLPVAWPQDALQHDKGSGLALHAIYKAQGLRMLDQHAQFENGSNSVEAGIMEILDRMRTGRFRVFENLAPWLDEFRTYHRKDGRIVKEHDHLLDSTRYGIMMLRRAAAGPNRRGRSSGPRQAEGGDEYAAVWGPAEPSGSRGIKPGRADFYSNPHNLGRR